jgi:hypothetical protein
MATKRKDDLETRPHFRSDLINVIGAEGFPRYSRGLSKDPFIDELGAKLRAGVARQFEKLRPTVRSV